MKPAIYARYEPVYRQAAALLPGLDKCPRIIDLGCGVGHFARMLNDKGYVDYLGIDFSEQMLEKARANTFEMEFVLGNLLDEQTQSIYQNERLFVLLEVLEHIEGDLAILESIPSGSQVIFSVPSFDAIAHVRRFKNEHKVVARYKKYLKFRKCKEIPWDGKNKVFLLDCTKK